VVVAKFSARPVRVDHDLARKPERDVNSLELDFAKSNLSRLFFDVSRSIFAGVMGRNSGGLVTLAKPAMVLASPPKFGMVLLCGRRR